MAYFEEQVENALNSFRKVKLPGSIEEPITHIAFGHEQCRFYIAQNIDNEPWEMVLSDVVGFGSPLPVSEEMQECFGEDGLWKLERLFLTVAVTKAVLIYANENPEPFFLGLLNIFEDKESPGNLAEFRHNIPSEGRKMILDCFSEKCNEELFFQIADLKTEGNEIITEIAETFKQTCGLHSPRYWSNETTLYDSAQGDPEVLGIQLAAACSYEDRNGAQLILKQKMVNVNAFHKGDHALLFAVQNNWEDIVEGLLSRGADPDLVGEDNRITGEEGEDSRPFALAVAAEYGHLNILKLLLKNGANPDLCPNGLTALQVLIENVNFIENGVDLVECLISFGANPNADHDLASIPIHMALAYADNLEVIRKLIPKADLEILDDIDLTPLLTACDIGDVNKVKILLEGGAKIDAIDSHGYTALHYAVIDNNIELAKLLVEYGADKKSLSKKGETPKDLADANGHIGIAELL